MAHVTITINGRSYRMGCDEGQEEEIEGLAIDLDQQIDRFRADFGEVGDMRLLLMAALEVADELAEMKQRLAAQEDEIANLRDADASFSERVSRAETAMATSLDAAAERVERLTASLNGVPAD